MQKYIEAIIEIVLEYVTCCHHVDSDGAGRKYDNVTYGIDHEQEVIKKCLLIKPEAFHIVDKEEFIEKKARAMHKEVYGSLINCDYQCNAMGKFRVQIRKIVEGR